VTKPPSSTTTRWYPTTEQLKDPAALHNTFRQLLEQHYALQDQVTRLTAQAAAPATKSPSGPPPGSGPTDTQICGLRVLPVDTQTLANGATLKWNKSQGNLQFS
jgi:hypothetical protein